MPRSSRWPGALEHAYPETNKGRTAQVLDEVSARGKLDTIGYQAAAVATRSRGSCAFDRVREAANLMLSLHRRQGERVRRAAGNRRVATPMVRQLLTESLLLASAGRPVGDTHRLCRHSVSLRALAASFAMTDMPISVDARIDTRVLLFTLVVSAATGLLFGLAPALQSSRLNLVPALKTSVMVARRRRWFTQRHALVTCEITLAVVVLTVAGMSIRGFIAKQHADPGFRTDGVLLMSFNPGLVNYSEDQTRRFYKGAVDRAKTLPGVVSVGLAEFIPLGFNGGTSPVVIDGYEMPAGQNRLLIGRNIVDDGYWHVMRTPIVRGRLFDERDTSSSPAVAIVNETMARRYWPSQDAIGKIVRLRDRSGPALQVVGIVKDGKYAFSR